MKFLIWFVVIALAVAWIMRSKKAPAQAKHDASKPQDLSRLGPTEAMLQCADCGTYFPASEAVTLTSGRVFCSEEHRRKAFPDD